MMRASSRLLAFLCTSLPRKKLFNDRSTSLATWSVSMCFPSSVWPPLPLMSTCCRVMARARGMYESRRDPGRRRATEGGRVEEATPCGADRRKGGHHRSPRPALSTATLLRPLSSPVPVRHQFFIIILFYNLELLLSTTFILYVPKKYDGYVNDGEDSAALDNVLLVCVVTFLTYVTVP